MGGAVRPGLLAVAAVALAALSLAPASAVESGWGAFDSRVARVVSLIAGLEDRGVEVSSLVEEVNRAVALYGAGDREGAAAVLAGVEERAASAAAPWWRPVARAAAAVGLAAAPLVVYSVVPRVYLRVWYWARRDWVVVERAGERRG